MFGPQNGPIIVQILRILSQKAGPCPGHCGFEIGLWLPKFGSVQFTPLMERTSRRTAVERADVAVRVSGRLSQQLGVTMNGARTIKTSVSGYNVHPPLPLSNLDTKRPLR